ncbi:MAG: signal peptide peptidase SppA [Akkermansia sp.]
MDYFILEYKDKITMDKGEMTQDTPPRTGSTKYFFLGCLSSFAILFSILVVLTLGIVASIGTIISEVEMRSNSILPQKQTVSSTLVRGDINAPDSIAIINVHGVISAESHPGGDGDCHSIVEMLNHAANDCSIRSVILSVDSPGGEVTASDVIYQAVCKLQQAGKPVIVMMGSLAASGGYYISAGADFIIANPTTLTGSIGVIISGINVEEGMQKLGIKNQVFKSGAFKDMLSMTRTMSESESTYIQEMVDQSYDRFVGIVEKGRKLTRQQLEKDHAIDGRVLSGSDAQHLGLVDQLGYFDDALAKAKELGHCPNAKIIQLNCESSISELLSMIGLEASAPKKISLEMSSLGLQQLKPGLPYMILPHYATGASSK